VLTSALQDSGSQSLSRSASSSSNSKKMSKKELRAAVEEKQRQLEEHKSVRLPLDPPLTARADEYA
jgi:Mg2+/Co2+ transporter CorB